MQVCSKTNHNTRFKTRPGSAVHLPVLFTIGANADDTEVIRSNHVRLRAMVSLERFGLVVTVHLLQVLCCWCITFSWMRCGEGTGREKNFKTQTDLPGTWRQDTDLA
jgi:hypothetical protein